MKKVEPTITESHSTITQNQTEVVKDSADLTPEKSVCLY